jgi:SAM-dependent methyltransferase
VKTELPNECAATEDFEFAALQEAGNYRATLIREFEPALHGRVLEIGAGVGQFTAQVAALPSVRTLVSVEPDEDFCRAFRAAHPQRTLIQGTSRQAPREPGWDTIVSINVLEHIRDDEAELGHCAELLRSRRGCLCLFVPARPEIYAPIDRDFGHFRRYGRRDLSAKLARAGFQIERLHYFNSLGYLLWWLNFCLLRKRRFEVSAVRAYDRIAFPAVAWLESHVHRPPVGQSLLAIARAR